MSDSQLDAFKSCQHCPSICFSIFHEVPNETLAQIDVKKSVQSYKKGQTLFIEGAPSFGLYCVGEGNIKISKMSSDGKESIVRIASEGQLIGHRSVFANQPYRASAISIADSKVCFISKEDIIQLVLKEPKVGLKLLKILATDLGLSENRLADFSQKNVRERVAVLLIYLSEHFGSQTPEGLRLEIKLTRDEMASIVGTATETLIRFLSEFKDDDIIIQDKKTIIIKNLEQLQKYTRGEI